MTDDPKPRVSISPYVPKGTMYRLRVDGDVPTDVFHDEEDAALWRDRPDLWGSFAADAPIIDNRAGG